MTHRRPSLHEIELDFEPIYSLTPEQYDLLVNTLFNLVVNLISRLEDNANSTESRRIAEQARDIFADYDDHLADILTRYLIASSHTSEVPSPTLTGNDICID